MVSSPIKLYLFWTIIILLFAIVFIPILSSGYSGGGELTLLSYTIYVFICGILVISILTPFLFKNWFAKYWFVSIGIIGTSILVLILSINNP